MADTNFSSTTTSSMNNNVQDFSVNAKQLDTPSMYGEIWWDSPYFTKYNGYYKEIPELKTAINSLAIWTVGKGFKCDNRTANNLRLISGWGEDSFQSILENMMIIKKINGDAFAEIIRDPESKIIINLKPLNPTRIRIVVDEQGIIDRYEYLDPNRQKVMNSLKREQIFHISNDRVGDEIHGVSVVEACQWVIDARNEAMQDWRRILHRSTIRVMYIDADNGTKLTDVKTQYRDAIKNGELLILPGKKGVDVEFEQLDAPPIQNSLEWIRYLEGFFYQAVGIPKAIANSQDFTEAASKVGYMTFEPVYTREQTLLEQDILNQLGWEITFNRPPALSGMVQESEEKNTGQLGFQPNELTAGVTRNE